MSIASSSLEEEEDVQNVNKGDWGEIITVRLFGEDENSTFSNFLRPFGPLRGSLGRHHHHRHREEEEEGEEIPLRH